MHNVGNTDREGQVLHYRSYKSLDRIYHIYLDDFTRIYGTSEKSPEVLIVSAMVIKTRVNIF